ncbi:DUF1415 domain-containing protein [Aliiglaciecola sp. CAU 1673]|uniref:DUF1415 domain-containing protein n=1 Tax=Aliiglaciecola sp. CAU 1673 TaxID=3032595 RepID=UPI0023DB2F0F|nr:DUF1415 domain-containing protein [Aliiglaciecola sp. CAU 1673]MDF2179597.1 DUF1415 domain-containing protein [Aliiglaciecola sp. CAU 1673]
MPEEVDVIALTKCWVETVVVGLNFCPFAKREVVSHSIRYVHKATGSVVKVVDWLLDECQYLDEHPQTATTLMVLSAGFEDFDDFLLMVDEANLAISRQGYEGTYQLAHFHPDYCFDDASPKEAGNYTNRAPLPTLHLLREESIERATANHPDPDSIPRRNVEKANQMGIGALAALLKECQKAVTKSVK